GDQVRRGSADREELLGAVAGVVKLPDVALLRRRAAGGGVGCRLQAVGVVVLVAPGRLRRRAVDDVADAACYIEVDVADAVAERVFVDSSVGIELTLIAAAGAVAPGLRFAEREVLDLADDL